MSYQSLIAFIDIPSLITENLNPDSYGCLLQKGQARTLELIPSSPNRNLHNEQSTFYSFNIPFSDSLSK